MKIILVASEITYCPDNYDSVLEAVLKGSKKHIAGIVIIKINFLDVLKKIPYLYFAGCKNMVKVLAQNTKEARLKTKEKLFKKYNIPILYAKSINDLNSILWIKQDNADLVINMRARCMYGDAILKAPRLGCVNLHHGLLPEQRGLFCDLHALADNKETGFTIHKMTKQTDCGPILYRRKVEKDNNYINYLRRSAPVEAKSLADFINKTAQNNSLSGGVLEKCDQPVITTTPRFKAIKQLQSKGMIL